MIVELYVEWHPSVTATPNARISGLSRYAPPSNKLPPAKQACFVSAEIIRGKRSLRNHP